MKPLNDDELSQMLKEWRAPQAPAGLREKALRPTPRGGLPSHIIVPTPVAALVLAALLVLGFFALRPPAEAPPADLGSSLASFEPAPDLNLRVVRLPDEND